MINKTKIIIPPINVIANFIGVPSLEDWKGNCYSIACKIVDDELINDDCRAVYGHYLGPVSSKSFFANRKDMLFIRHGWILLSNGDIIDPTRWVFEAKEPYIAFMDEYDDVTEEYDEGGDRWREQIKKPAPLFNKKDKCYPIVLEDKDCKEYFLDILSDKRGKDIKEISLNQMFWLANQSLITLGIYAKDILTWVSNMGQNALIPLDNRMKILGKD